MRKLRQIFLNIPRRVRIGVDIILILLMIYLFYLSIGAPAFTTEQAFRRAEKINMVGPGEIIDTLAWSEYPMFETLIVAETEEGVIFFGEYRTGDSSAWPKWLNIEYRKPIFSYREKTGDLTVLGAPVGLFGMADMGFVTSYPLYVFDDYPEAVRAELEMTVTGYSTVPEASCTVTAEAIRQEDGFFRFLLENGNRSALDHVAHVSSGDFYFRWLTDSERSASIPVTVRLYDENDRLLLETELAIQSPAVQAQETQSDP